MGRRLADAAGRSGAARAPAGRRGGWRPAGGASQGAVAGGVLHAVGGLGGTWGGYGRMQLDLLAPFDPAIGAGCCRTSARRNTWRRQFLPGLGALLVMLLGALAWLAGPRQGACGALSARCCWCWRGCCCSPSRIAWRSAGGSSRSCRCRSKWWRGWMRCGPRTLLLAGGLCGGCSPPGRRWWHGWGAAGGLVLAAAMLVQAVDLRPGFARCITTSRCSRPPCRCGWPPLLARGGAALCGGAGGADRHAGPELGGGRSMPPRSGCGRCGLSARVSPSAVTAVNARVARGSRPGSTSRGPSTCSATRRRWRAPRAGMDPARDLLARIDGRVGAGTGLAGAGSRRGIALTGGGGRPPLVTRQPSPRRRHESPDLARSRHADPARDIAERTAGRRNRRLAAGGEARGLRWGRGAGARGLHMRSRRLLPCPASQQTRGLRPACEGMKKAIPAAEEFGAGRERSPGLRIRTLAGIQESAPCSVSAGRSAATSCTTSATHAPGGAERGGAARDLLGEILRTSRNLNHSFPIPVLCCEPHVATNIG